MVTFHKEGNSEDQGYDGNVGQRGNSEKHVVRRLKRDAPELATALARRCREWP
jgi:hypothetical protein